MQPQTTLNAYITDAIRRYWDLPALTDLGSSTLTYKDVARKIAKLHILYKEIGLTPGDKIALCGRNSSQWCVAFLSVITYGAVVVPILADFKPDNIQHLINHSEARLAIIDENIWEALNPDSMSRLIGTLAIRDFSLLHSNDDTLSHVRAHLNELFGHAYPDRFTTEHVRYYEEDNSELCLISYTSGSTGFSKGVMLPYLSLWSNVQECLDHINSEPGDGVVCMLPLAHMYGLTIDMLRPFVSGHHINVLTRTPSPRILAEAFAQVHPRIIVVVPLILEKIIRTQVFPMLEKPLMKLMLMVPYVDARLLGKIRSKLLDVFGGHLEQIIIGGAALNKDVERFLRRCNFPYTVGYGMTECGPLISFAPADENRMGSCGQIVDRMEARIDSSTPETVPGVLWVKGDNVMMGYYKNPEATAEALTPEGWLCTGDICNLDNDGFLYIRGRDKNMILGPSGQNIYPEEIEDKLNNLPYVSESLIVDSGQGKLMALIVPDLESAGSQGFNNSDLMRIMEENIATLNDTLPAYSRVIGIRIHEEEFEKTPKRSIKRYLYKA